MTDQQDVINGAIETVAGLLQFVNAYALYRDKQIKGTSYWSVIFYVGWGVWGAYYYPHIHQPWSSVGNAFILGSNLCWLSLAWWYRPRMCRKCNGAGVLLDIQRGPGNHRLIPCSSCWGWYTKDKR